MPSVRVCFDIETEPFSDEFLAATTPLAKERAAPPMRLACIYLAHQRRYRFFTPDQSGMLIELLQGADEVISFNGLGFDVLVLRRHYGLSGKVPRKGVHIDLHSILSERAGFRVSLNVAAQLNLGERKHTAGRAMGNLNLADLREACKADVRQTWRLWKLHDANALQAPRRRRFSFGGGGSDWHGGPGSFMPNFCPICHDIGSLEFLDWDGGDEMSDGQMAEYLAGTQGSAVCTTCNHVAVWNV